MSGPLRVPVSEILAYCTLFYISNITERERLFRYVNSLDSAYLSHVADQQSKNPAK